VSNEEIADQLALYAALLELAEANTYAVRTYRRAAEMIRSSPADFGALVHAGRARELRGIGPSVESRLVELVQTGRIAELDRLRDALRPDLAALGHLLGLSSKRMLAICDALGIAAPAEFRDAVVSGRLADAPRVGPVTLARLRAGLARDPRPRRGLRLGESRQLLQSIADRLGGAVAGDARRYAPQSFELSVVVPGADPRAIVDRFRRLPDVVSVVEEHTCGAVGLTSAGVPVELRVSDPAAFGTELIRATGTQEYVAALEPLPQGATEESVYRQLGLPWCPPELRERPHPTVPSALVEPGDVRGDLHCHTAASDGHASVLEMATAARDNGLEYLAVCDHTTNVRVVPGLLAEDLRRQGEEIAAVNEQLSPFRVLRGVECDILADGALDLDDESLGELDWVQLSLHAGQRRSRADLTRIVTEAMRNPHVRALSHPTGRILDRRPENALDLDVVYAVALETGVALELNGLPDRLDLSPEHAAEAVAAGVRLVVASDAHSVRGLGNLELAVRMARRAGVTADAILNTRPVSEILRPG
jgi:DNA polymerase (family X)